MSNKLLEATKAAGLNFYLNLNFWKSKNYFSGYFLKSSFIKRMIVIKLLEFMKTNQRKKWGTGSLQAFWWCLLYLSKTLGRFSLLLSGCSDLRPSESRDWELRPANHSWCRTICKYFAKSVLQKLLYKIFHHFPSNVDFQWFLSYLMINIFCQFWNVSWSKMYKNQR